MQQWFTNDKGENDKAPDFRLQAAGNDIGAAWKKASEAGTYDLLWTRSKPQAA